MGSSDHPERAQGCLDQGTGNGDGAGRTGPAHLLSWVAGRVAWKAAATVMVLASIVDTQAVKVTPKAARHTAQVNGPGA